MAQPVNLDLEKLIKLLGMTTADNDGEALAAMRLANRHLDKMMSSQNAKGSTAWDALLRGHFTIAADPFQGIEMPQFGNKSAPPPMDPAQRPQPAQPQRPDPSSYAPPPPRPRPQAPPRPAARPAQPQPQAKPFDPAAAMNAGASGPMGNSQSNAGSQSGGKRRNYYRAVCYKCSHWCEAGDGFLDHKSTTSNSWLVSCADTAKCAANSKLTGPKAKQGAAKSVDNLANILGS